MKLPILDIPLYETTLPVSGKKVKYRPYTVKEEEILLMAASDEENNEDVQLAVIQIIENCCGIEFNKTHPADAEYMFMKLRAASFSNLINVTMTIKNGCSTEECPETLNALANIDTIELRGEKQLEALGFKRNKDGWAIPITDKIGLVVFPVNELSDDPMRGLYNSIVYVWNEDEIITKDNFSYEELVDWINGLTRSSSDLLKAFFNAQPYIVLPIKAKCPQCGKEYVKEIDGLLDFFG